MYFTCLSERHDVYKTRINYSRGMGRLNADRVQLILLPGGLLHEAHTPARPYTPHSRLVQTTSRLYREQPDRQ